MGETQKRYRVTYKGKDSRQYVTLLARSEEEARALAHASQERREARFPLTFSRVEDGTIPGGKVEMERRERDAARYESGELKVEKVEEVK